MKAAWLRLPKAQRSIATHLQHCHKWRPGKNQRGCHSACKCTRFAGRIHEAARLRRDGRFTSHAHAACRVHRRSSARTSFQLLLLVFFRSLLAGSQSTQQILIPQKGPRLVLVPVVVVWRSAEAEAGMPPPPATAEPGVTATPPPAGTPCKEQGGCRVESQPLLRHSIFPSRVTCFCWDPPEQRARQPGRLWWRQAQPAGVRREAGLECYSIDVAQVVAAPGNVA